MINVNIQRQFILKENYIDDEKNPGSYKEYENGELNDIK